MADAGLISNFYLGDKSFTSYLRDNVSITYLAPPVIEGYQEIEAGAGSLWRIPMVQPCHNLRSGYSFSLKALAANDLNHVMQTVASKDAPELVLNVYNLPSIKQAVH